MQLLVPVAITVGFTFIQLYFVTNYFIKRAILFNVFFTLLIVFFISDFDFYAYAVIGNFMFYLMTFAAFITRPKFETF
jgi:hypothetical protein